MIFLLSLSLPFFFANILSSILLFGQAGLYDPQKQEAKPKGQHLTKFDVYFFQAYYFLRHCQWWVIVGLGSGASDYPGLDCIDSFGLSLMITRWQLSSEIMLIFRARKERAGDMGKRWLPTEPDGSLLGSFVGSVPPSDIHWHLSGQICVTWQGNLGKLGEGGVVCYCHCFLLLLFAFHPTPSKIIVPLIRRKGRMDLGEVNNSLYHRLQQQKAGREFACFCLSVE